MLLCALRTAPDIQDASYQVRGRRRRVRKTQDRREKRCFTEIRARSERGEPREKIRAAAVRARRDDRRANRGLLPLERRSAPGLAMASISFPSANALSCTRMLTTPVRDRETTLTCARVFSRRRHIFFSHALLDEACKIVALIVSISDRKLIDLL